MDKKQAIRISTIYNRSVVSKAEIRAESEDAITAFLRNGGVIEVAKTKKTRRRTTQKMSGKTSKGFQSGTSGFATGYPKRSII